MRMVILQNMLASIYLFSLFVLYLCFFCSVKTIYINIFIINNPKEASSHCRANSGGGVLSNRKIGIGFKKRRKKNLKTKKLHTAFTQETYT